MAQVDDEALVEAMAVMMGDVESVHRNVKFTRSYTLERMGRRWRHLLAHGMMPAAAAARSRNGGGGGGGGGANYVWSDYEEMALKKIVSDLDSSPGNDNSDDSGLQAFLALALQSFHPGRRYIYLVALCVAVSGGYFFCRCVDAKEPVG